MCVQLKSGDSIFTEKYNFKRAGTSNSTQTINYTSLPTISQLENLVVECTLGYYGGAINGVTVFVEYETSSGYYTYSTIISGDMTILVSIGSTKTNNIRNGNITPTKIYVGSNEVSKMYKGDTLIYG